MKKFILSIAVLFTAVTISFACGEEKKSCCKKGEKKECSQGEKKACANKDEKTCAKAKSCCKKKAADASIAPAANPAETNTAR